MRLFNRRKEIEFDDPRLVGMAPLKPTEEGFGGSRRQREREQEQNHNQNQNHGLPTLTEERPTDLQESLTSTSTSTPTRNGNGVSTWKRVVRPWDSLRRTESSEHLSRSVISNRRKTLHFYGEVDPDIRGSSIPIRIPSSASSEYASSPAPRVRENVTVSAIPAVTPPKKKLGRVESLRLLLSKSNRIYRGKSANLRQDKGTDTTDLGGGDSPSETYPSFAVHHDEAYHSKYSSISSLKSDTLYYPLCSSQLPKRKDSIMKATSCENLSLQHTNVNQGRTLPGYRDMSTSTSPFLDSSCFSPQPSSSMTTKRSSFPYAYIRSRLTSLQEEPKKNQNKSPAKPPRLSIMQNQEQNQKKNKPCSLASNNFMHKGFYHSMGNLLSETKEEGHSSLVDAETEDEVDGDADGDAEPIISPGIFDPLKQIRIDLLHRNPSDLDEQSPSPTSFWGRRSYSIGDMLEKRKVGKSNSGGIEESGYDSDSTRNGHESPRNSVKSPSSETEQEMGEGDEKRVKEKSTTINGKSETESLDSSDPQSSSSSGNSDTDTGSSSSSNSASAYSFPASGGCLITINPGMTTGASKRPAPVHGFRKAEDGSIIEVTTEIDQSEHVDICPIAANTNDEIKRKPSKETMTTSCLKSRSNSVSNVFVSNEREKPKEKSVTLLEPNKNLLTPGTTMKDGNEQKNSSAPSLRLRNRVRDKDRSEWSSVKPSRSKSLCLSIFTINFQKGPQKKSLGFSVIGGKDSPIPGIFVKRIFPYGQANEHGGLSEGDEILSVNGQPLANYTHAEALNIFKSIKAGEITMEVARREFLSSSTSKNLKRQYSQLSSKSCEQLNQVY